MVGVVCTLFGCARLVRRCRQKTDITIPNEVNARAAVIALRITNMNGTGDERVSRALNTIFNNGSLNLTDLLMMGGQRRDADGNPLPVEADPAGTPLERA